MAKIIFETLMDVNEVAAATGKKPKTIRQMCWRRQIEFLKISRSIRFRPSVIDALLGQCVIPVREIGARKRK